MSSAKNTIIKDIVDQHFEEASFLWSQRDAAVTASNYTLEDLVFLDERVEAHIDGLRVAGDYAWDLCEAGMDPEDPGTVFTASVIAFESGDAERIEQVVGTSNESHAVFRAAVSGLGWMNKERFNAMVVGMVSAKSRRYRRLGIAACGVRHVNPRGYLDQAINSSDIFLKARALKTAGQLKRVDLLSQLQAHFQSEDDICRFAAAKSALLIGDKSALDILSGFVLSKSALTLPAMQIALRIVDRQTARNWLKTLSRNPDQVREMLLGTGFTGDCAYIPMLIKQMERPEYARAAGEAFSIITGVNLTNENLEGDRPDGFEAGPNDDPENEDVEMDLDENLSWPNVERVSRWWEQNEKAFPNGTRFLAGSPISSEHCWHILKTGNQRYRQAAALEIALSNSDSVHFNIKAPGMWQINKINQRVN
jgi:uncharacterized protein (TIGR02270 family)